jgi:hypothetical protein
MSLTNRLQSGAVIPARKHCHADATVFVCKGDFIEDGITQLAVTFFADPTEHFHGPHSTRIGCTVLKKFSARFDFVLTSPAQP